MTNFATYPNKRLCEVVFPGTHDAGIYGDELGATAKTQNLSIYEQARAGVRYFDLRIITVKTSAGVLEQHAFHAPKFKTVQSPLGEYHKPRVAKGISIGTGVGNDLLMQMLNQAYAFVVSNPGEFLMLRFSKCADMNDVAQQCILHLADKHFQGNVNLNRALVSDLQGSVVTLFDEGDYGLLPLATRNSPGILPVRATFDKNNNHAAYNGNFNGLQYFGKYSNNRDMKKNAKKQKKIMASLGQGPSSAPELLGMMYWTLTTGMNPFLLFESIESRDKKMWNAGMQALVTTWKSGVKDHIVARAGRLRSAWNGLPPPVVARQAKSFMPNIIMMDFADDRRCASVWALNGISDQMMAQMNNDILNDHAI